jgi:hypothetical protein
MVCKRGNLCVVISSAFNPLHFALPGLLLKTNPQGMIFTWKAADIHV